MSRKRAGGCCLIKERPSPRIRLQQSFVAPKLPRTEGGLETRGGRHIRHRDPPRIAGPAFHLSHLIPVAGFAKLRRGVEQPKGEDHSENTTWEDREDRRRRHIHPRCDFEMQRGDFPNISAPSRRALGFSTYSFSHIHHMWGSIGSSGLAADRGRKVGN